MTAKRVVIISTGVANTASVAAAFRRCGAEIELTTNPDVIYDAARVVLPGVGSFGAGVSRLRSQGMADAIVRRVDAGRPLLAICLGLQLLCESSEESPGVAGLGIIDADVRRFPVGVRAPHFGWNRVEADPSCSLLESGYACYAHSYRVVGAPAGWSASMTTHGAPFVAAMVRGPLCACQFHPELSGEWGQKLLERWLACEGVGSSC